jgi:hypothetical protein
MCQLPQQYLDDQIANGNMDGFIPITKLECEVWIAFSSRLFCVLIAFASDCVQKIAVDGVYARWIEVPGTLRS